MADTTIPAAHRGANPATILQLEAERLRQLRDELDHLDDVEQIGPVLTDVANQLEALVVSGAVMLSRDGAALVRGALRRALEAQGGSVEDELSVATYESTMRGATQMALKLLGS